MSDHSDVESECPMDIDSWYTLFSTDYDSYVLYHQYVEYYGHRPKSATHFVVFSKKRSPKRLDPISKQRAMKAIKIMATEPVKFECRVCYQKRDMSKFSKTQLKKNRYSQKYRICNECIHYLNNRNPMDLWHAYPLIINILSKTLSINTEFAEALTTLIMDYLPNEYEGVYQFKSEISPHEGENYWACDYENEHTITLSHDFTFHWKHKFYARYVDEGGDRLWDFDENWEWEGVFELIHSNQIILYVEEHGLLQRVDDDWVENASPISIIVSLVKYDEYQLRLDDVWDLSRSSNDEHTEYGMPLKRIKTSMQH